MIDYKYTALSGGARTFVLGTQMLRDAADVLASLRVDRARALEELESDWTTSMELAETLAARAAHPVPRRPPLRVRGRRLRAPARPQAPKAFPYAEAVRIYAEAGRKYQIADTRLPLDEAAVRRTLSPAMMVRTRVGIGGPQPTEVRRMIVEAKKALAADRAWLDERRNRIAEAEARLNRSFAELLAR